MTTALARNEYRPTEVAAPNTLAETVRLADILVKSGFFKDLRDASQGVTKILYGREIGFGPIASVLGIYIVDGRPSLAAQLIASAVQKSNRYRYRVREWNAKVCRIEFFEGSESLGESSFSIEEATTAGLANKATWKAYPKAMLWARAVSQGARAFTPEIFNGAVYTPEELGAEVDAEGNVVVEDDDLGWTGQAASEYVPLHSQAEDGAGASDTVTNADERIWQRWLSVKGEAEGLGIRVSAVRLPIARDELAKRGSQVFDAIQARKQQLAEQDERAAQGAVAQAGAAF